MVIKLRKFLRLISLVDGKGRERTADVDRVRPSISPSLLYEREIKKKKTIKHPQKCLFFQEIYDAWSPNQKHEPVAVLRINVEDDGRRVNIRSINSNRSVLIGMRKSGNRNRRHCPFGPAHFDEVPFYRVSPTLSTVRDGFKRLAVMAFDELEEFKCFIRTLTTFLFKNG
jgi:hypothetical protein